MPTKACMLIKASRTCPGQYTCRLRLESLCERRCSIHSILACWTGAFSAALEATRQAQHLTTLAISTLLPIPYHIMTRLPSPSARRCVASGSYRGAGQEGIP
eukprot:4108229-Pyramimonas_sp.AAC.2